MNRLDSTHSARRLQSGGGFTLIELVGVIVIIAVLAVTAAPTLNKIAGSRSAMASKQLLRDLTYARQRAIASGTKMWVVFDTAGESWSLLEEDPDNPGRSNAAVIGDTATGQNYVISLGSEAYVGVDLVSAAFDGNDEVGFDWLGQPLNQSETSLAAQGVVTLAGGHVVNVAVSTGYATHVAP